MLHVAFLAELPSGDSSLPDDRNGYKRRYRGGIHRRYRRGPGGVSKKITEEDWDVRSRAFGNKSECTLGFSQHERTGFLNVKEHVAEYDHKTEEWEKIDFNDLVQKFVDMQAMCSNIFTKHMQSENGRDEVKLNRENLRNSIMSFQDKLSKIMADFNYFKDKLDRDMQERGLFNKQKLRERFFLEHGKVKSLEYSFNFFKSEVDKKLKVKVDQQIIEADRNKEDFWW